MGGEPAECICNLKLQLSSSAIAAEHLQLQPTRLQFTTETVGGVVADRFAVGWDDLFY